MWTIKSITRELQKNKKKTNKMVLISHYQVTTKDKKNTFPRPSIQGYENKIQSSYLYPHSLSYQETSFTKLSFKEIPALASNMLDLHMKVTFNMASNQTKRKPKTDNDSLSSNVASKHNTSPVITNKISRHNIIFGVTQNTLQFAL